MTDKLAQTIPTPLELRAMLEAMVRADLLGPAGGPAEIVDERNVRDRYIVGRLAPRGQRLLPDEQDELALGGAGGDDQDGKAELGLSQTATIYPSSIGLTFSVAGTAEAIQIMARYGQYQRLAAESVPDYKGQSPLVWQRRPVEATSAPISLKPGDLGPWRPDPNNADVYVRGLCRRRDACWTITLFLVNAQPEPKTRIDEAWLFQPELRVTAPDNAPIFVKRQLPPELSAAEPEDRAMNLLYRRQVEFAVGHNVAVHAELASDGWDRAVAVRTEVIPSYEVERMDPPSVEDVPQLGQAVLDMKTLAETEQGHFTAAIAPLADAYEGWIAEQETQLSQAPSDLQPYTSEAGQALAHCREALARMRTGLALLDRDPQAAEAFRFANRAMYLQRIHSIYARQVRQGQEPDLAHIDRPQERSWRPFQLAFVLLNLPGLVDPTDPARSDPTNALADLLWFPTGGGKTEAYLGIAAFAMAIRRLQPELGGLSGQAGVTVLMRYTLRLLTLQQFQRAAALICACETIRRDKPAKWGAEPFRIGLWVGQRSTPNWTKEAAEAIKKDHDLGWGSGLGAGGTPYQLTNCPWCGQPINPGKNIVVETVEQGRGRTFQYCSDKLGQCPFSRRQAPDEGLPIVVVDE
ncbi:MAG TPA: helicase, partial [Anaerolineae bacterium]|nr:helicase [Anaerolineae bacterium]